MARQAETLFERGLCEHCLHDRLIWAAPEESRWPLSFGSILRRLHDFFADVPLFSRALGPCALPISHRSGLPLSWRLN